MKSGNYFLPEDYKENPLLTFSEEPREYWTDARIKSSHFFQYHVYEYAGKLFKSMAMESLLDIGAGPGTKIPFFFDLDEVKLTLIDQPGMDEITKETCPNADFHGVNLEEDQLTTGRKYDMIICSDVIEHLGDPKNLLEIIKSHLADDGRIVLSTPDREMRREKGNLQSPNKAHVREWSSKELRSYLDSEGFKILEQRNYPLKKLSPAKLWISQGMLYRTIKLNEWFACQMLILSV